MDPRSLRSRDLLKKALLRLIECNSFDKITLRDITATAGVSYPTMFNHYVDKDDLFQDIARHFAFAKTPQRGIAAQLTVRRVQPGHNGGPLDFDSQFFFYGRKLFNMNLHHLFSMYDAICKQCLVALKEGWVKHHRLHSLLCN